VAGTGTLLKRTGRSQRQYYDKERKRLLDQLLSPYSSAPMSFGLNASKVDFSHIIETRLFPQISPAPDLFRGSRTHAFESNFRRLFLVPGQKLVVQRTQESRPPLPRPAFVRDILPDLDASLLGNANSLALCLVGSSQQESWKAIRGGVHARPTFQRCLLLSSSTPMWSEARRPFRSWRNKSTRPWLIRRLPNSRYDTGTGTAFFCVVFFP
jgi:hypothetical protein